MKWIIGFTEQDALELDATLLAATRKHLRTFAEVWGAFKHPDRAEWCVPWDDDRAALAQMLPVESRIIEIKTAEGKIKRDDNMQAENWRRPTPDSIDPRNA